MKVLLANDIHISDRPPSSCTESYADDLFALLWQTVGLVAMHRVSVVVWPGDVFHNKAPNRNSHRLVQRLIEVIQGYGVPVYIVPGNHDYSNDRPESIFETQPLGVLFRAGARLLSGPCPEYPQLYGVPWQQTWDDEHVGLALREYEGRGLVVTHAPLYPPGLELPYEFYPSEKWAEIMGGGYCWYGHVHEHHGVWRQGSVVFANFGALSRGSLHEHNLTREVSVGLWDSVSGKFDRIPLQAKPAEEVFRLREAREITDTRGKLDEFLMSVGNARLEVLSTETVLAHVRALQPGKAVEDEVEELLAWSANQGS